MTIDRISNHDVVTCSRETNAVELAGLMRERHTGDVVVTESDPRGEVPVGIVTDRDLVVEVLAANDQLHAPLVKLISQVRGDLRKRQGASD